MPGHPLYWISRRIDDVSAWWYWGNFAKVKYYLKISDKYLVEAKTLFEYKQYLFGSDALSRSDDAFNKITKYMKIAKSENKDIRPLQTTISDVFSIHKRVLSTIKSEVPKYFVWAPEKTEATQLPLERNIEASTVIREKVDHDVKKL
jgi:hypothetical protein